jgi:hypothetical protein
MAAGVRGEGSMSIEKLTEQELAFIQAHERFHAMMGKIEGYTTQSLITTLFRLIPRDISRGYLAKFPMIHCADGFKMSVQASETHYCEPRNDMGPWTEFEVGYPSQREPLLELYADGDPEEDVVNVYGYVPAEVIDEVIAKHGGIVRLGA